jgi:DNA modification methylase
VIDRLFYSHAGIYIVNADTRAYLAKMEDESVDCVITSPPYWALRDYGVDGQIGMEETHEEYVAVMVEFFRHVRRVLTPIGTLWLNLGDSYAGAAGGWQGKDGDRASRTFTARMKMEKRGPGIKPKDLIGIPWRIALALQADGWWLRSDIVWHKPNPMPESVTDRPSRAHEYVFLITKGERYYYDANAIREPLSPNTVRKPRLDVDGNPVGANKRSVWTVTSEPFLGAHFATFPTALVKPMVLAGCPVGGMVLDPFAGSGTTLLVAKELGRRAIGIELNPDYCSMAVKRLRQDVLPLTQEGHAK